MFALTNRLHLNKNLYIRHASVLARTTHKPSVASAHHNGSSLQQRDAIPTDPLQFILGKHHSMDVRTASEARARAKQQLEELQMVVVNANRILGTLERREKLVNQQIRDYRIIMGGGVILLGGGSFFACVK